MARRRQPDIKYRVIVTGPNGTRGDTVFAEDIGKARFQATNYVLRDGERIHDIYIDRR